MEKGQQHFLKGAMVLSIAGGLSKILGAIYRIPLARLLGGEGVALYQLAYPIYTAILSLATAGVPVAISVLVARKETEGYTGDSKRIFQVAMATLLIFGLLLTLLVMLAAPYIARYVLNEPRTTYAILAVAPAIFLSGIMSVFRGYFQGQQTMMPTAVSQTVEQLFRVAAVLILAFLLFPRGLEFAAAGATSGAVVGGLIGIVVLAIYYYRFNRSSDRAKQSLVYSDTSSWTLMKEMVRLAVPVSFGAVVLPLVQMLDAIIVPRRLLALHYTATHALALYGELAGMAAILIGLPTIFTIAISTSLVPAVSEAFARHDRQLLNSRLNYAFRAGMIISFPCAAGLFILAFPICDLLYHTPEAGYPLEYLAFSCIMLSAFQLSSAGLQGIGRPEIAMRNLIITGLLKVVFNYSLTSVPALNIQGAALGTVLAFLIGSLLNLIWLRKISGVSYEGLRLLKITLVTVFMAIVTRYAYLYLVGIDIHSRLATVIAIAVGTLIYGLALFIVQELDIDIVTKIVRGK
ncbi:MAG TPA: polysaccharide biosynthesis protein [Syntrophomonadaceae bacterium]|nr:polysaccharide biosynthesis protein [Syntrophomonadaceae bacterium]